MTHITCRLTAKNRESAPDPDAQQSSMGFLHLCTVVACDSGGSAGRPVARSVDGSRRRRRHRPRLGRPASRPQLPVDRRQPGGRLRGLGAAAAARRARVHRLPRPGRRRTAAARLPRRHCGRLYLSIYSFI